MPDRVDLGTFRHEAIKIVDEFPIDLLPSSTLNQDSIKISDELTDFCTNFIADRSIAELSMIVSLLDDNQSHGKPKSIDEYEDYYDNDNYDDEKNSICDKDNFASQRHTSPASISEEKLKDLSKRIQNTKLASLLCSMESRREIKRDLGDLFDRDGYYLPLNIDPQPLAGQIGEKSDDYEHSILLSIAVYSPVEKNSPLSAINKPNVNVKLFHLQQEFLLDASQPLTSLRDVIYCIHDYDSLESELPPGFPWMHLALQHQKCAGPTKSTAESGYFFVNDTFYNDFRCDKAIDYSLPIIQWVSEDERRSGKFGNIYAAKMQDVTFSQIQWDLNGKNLYVHLGDCVHLFIVTQIRIKHPSIDPKSLSSYPYLIYQQKIKRRKCSMCDLYSARLVTFGDKFAPENPCFFCTKCFDGFHRDADGNMLYNDFDVLKYIHD